MEGTLSVVNNCCKWRCFLRSLLPCSCDGDHAHAEVRSVDYSRSLPWKLTVCGTVISFIPCSVEERYLLTHDVDISQHTEAETLVNFDRNVTLVDRTLVRSSVEIPPTPETLVMEAVPRL